jgi:regulator of protease activity HflC (stomatin/prohibitin superfamily)
LLAPGLHTRKLWEKVHEFSVMEKVVDLGGDDGAFQLMTGDGTLLKLESKARLKLSSEKYHSFVFGLRRPMEHVRELFRCLLRNEIANVSSNDEGAYSNVRKQMATLNRDIQRACDSGVQGHYGIELRSVDIVDVLPPHELARALNAIEKTRADVSALYMRALADSEQRVEAARQGVKIALMRSEGTAREIAVIGEALEELERAGTLDEYVEQRRVEVFSDAKLSMVRRTHQWKIQQFSTPAFSWDS